MSMGEGPSVSDRLLTVIDHLEPTGEQFGIGCLPVLSQTLANSHMRLKKNRGFVPLRVAFLLPGFKLASPIGRHPEQGIGHELVPPCFWPGLSLPSRTEQF